MDLAALVLDRGADRDELGHVGAPLVTPDLDRTPTIPSAPSCSASSSIRVIASSRAEHIAWVNTPISWLCFQFACWKPMW